MVWLSIVFAAIAPGVALMAYFYLKDRYDSEPISLVIKIFMLGVLLVFPTMVLQRIFMESLGNNPFVTSFLLSGGIEEFVKWFVLYYVFYKHAEFDEPYDGIVYGAAISLGYATLENVIYDFVHHFTFSELMLRAFLPVSGHALFAVLMGYYMGKAKFVKNGVMERKWLFYSYLLPVFWHGLFDYILMVTHSYWIWFMLPLMAYLWYKGMKSIANANDNSPFKVFHHEEELHL